MIKALETNGYGVKIMAGYAVIIEEFWYYNGSPESDVNCEAAEQGWHNLYNL